MKHTYRFWVCDACLVRPCYFITIDSDKPTNCPFFGIPEWKELKPQQFVRQVAKVNGR